jgi:hypothetical protein
VTHYANCIAPSSVNRFCDPEIYENYSFWSLKLENAEGACTINDPVDGGQSPTHSSNGDDPDVDGGQPPPSSPGSGDLDVAPSPAGTTQPTSEGYAVPYPAFLLGCLFTLMALANPIVQ